MWVSKKLKQLVSWWDWRRRYNHLGKSALKDIQTIMSRGRAATIVDVGANEGQSARRFAKIFPNAHIFSFEPASTNYEQLVINSSK